jgi:hypothetical protein
MIKTRTAMRLSSRRRDLLQNQVVVKQKWTGIIAVAFVLLFVAVIPASAAGAPSWSSPVDVSAIGQHADNPQVVAESNGSLAAIWEGTDGTNDVVQASRSTDSGATWATPVTLSASGQSPFFPHIVAAPNGSLTAVWELSNVGNNRVQASQSASGSSWSAPFDLATFSGEPSSPQIVAAPDGTVTAVWQGQSNVIQSSHSVNGTSWSAPTTFPSAGWGGMSPQIASATDSSLTAVWSSFDGSSYVVQSSHSADGSSWSAPSQIAVAGAAPASPQTVAGPDGTMTVVWNQTNGVIQASHSANGGLTWDAPATLSGAGADPPHIALAPDGTLAAVWDRFDGSNYIVQSSHSSDGSTWSAAADLSTAGLSAVNPQIVAGSDSALTVAWSSFNSSSSSNSYIVQTGTGTGTARRQSAGCRGTRWHSHRRVVSLRRHQLCNSVRVHCDSAGVHPWRAACANGGLRVFVSALGQRTSSADLRGYFRGPTGRTDPFFDRLDLWQADRGRNLLVCGYGEQRGRSGCRCQLHPHCR